MRIVTSCCPERELPIQMLPTKMCCMKLKCLNSLCEEKEEEDDAKESRQCCFFLETGKIFSPIKDIGLKKTIVWVFALIEPG